MKTKLKEIVQPIVKWYQAQEKTLPWKQDKDPYHVWISEIMLQQTRIEAVKKYYIRFMEQLPTIQDVANASEEQLLKLWEGLGYYSRVRNIKKAAIQIIQENQGKMPTNYKELLKMPGIGDYTAGAIASISYGEKVPAVDGNVLRVISRILASKENVLLPETKKDITNQLQEIMPEEAGDFNEGLMELGEKICLPNTTPICNKCPIQKYCTACKENLTTEIPVRIKKQKRKIEKRTIFILEYKNKIAINKRPKTGILANLYEFPNILGEVTEQEIPQILKQWNIQFKNLKMKKSAKHIFTHIEWDMIAYEIEVKNKNTIWTWVTEQEMEKQYPLPTAFKKLHEKSNDL